MPDFQDVGWEIPPSLLISRFGLFGWRKRALCLELKKGQEIENEFPQLWTKQEYL